MREVVLEKLFPMDSGECPYKTFTCTDFEVLRFGIEPATACREYDAFVNWFDAWNYHVIAVKDVQTISIPELANLRKTPDGCELFFSLRAFVHFWAPLVCERVCVPAHFRCASQSLVHSVRDAFQLLENRGLIAIRSAPKARQAKIAIVGNMGFLRGATADEASGGLIASGGYYIANPDECVSRYQTVGDTIGLIARDGRIENPPTYRRPVLVCGRGNVRVQDIGVSEICVEMSCGLTAVYAPETSSSPQLLTTAGRGGRKTRMSADALDLVIVGTQIVSARWGGGTEIPDTGVVVTLPNARAFGDALTQIEAAPEIVLTIAGCPGLKTAIQGGPRLVSRGEYVDEVSALREAELVAADPAHIVVPSGFFRSVGQVLAQRSGIGIREDGSLCVVFVPGSPTMHSILTGAPNRGASLETLARILILEGVRDGFALDSGGSAQLFHGTRQIVGSGDARGNLDQSFDRWLPNALYYC